MTMKAGGRWYDVSKDEDIIALVCDRCKNGSALWSGDYSAYMGKDGQPDHSSGDFALLSHISYYVGPNPSRIDSLFRQSGMMRDKWDERHGTMTYGARSIEAMLAGRSEFFQPGERRSRNGKKGNAPPNGGGNGDPPHGRRSGDWQPGDAFCEAIDDPHRLARTYLQAHHQHATGCTLAHWRGEYHHWRDNAYHPVEISEVKSAVVRHVRREYEHAGPHDDQGNIRKVHPSIINSTLQALASLVQLPGRQEAPCWLPGESPGWPAREVLSTASGLVCLRATTGEERATAPATTRFFTPFALDYPYQADAPAPTQWLAFLNQLWPGDQESINLAQEWAGYLLSGDTSQQKMILFLGPPRSGKGTFVSVIVSLVGKANVASPSLHTLGSLFGLAPLLGKTLATIGDARLSNRTDIAPAVERLLTISGEDDVTIERKHLPAITDRLPVRFMLMTNELPKLTDASGALAGRFLVLRTTTSHFGREDTGLTDRLLTERTGILKWALAGLERLRARGKFVQPSSNQDVVDSLLRLTSSITSFVCECCLLDETLAIGKQELFDAWQDWARCAATKPVNRETFYRDLRSRYPAVYEERPREGGKRLRLMHGIDLSPEFYKWKDEQEAKAEKRAK